MARTDPQRILARLLCDYPELHDELFRFTDPEVRALAEVDPTQLSKRDHTKLADRAKYIALTRIIKQPRKEPAPDCRGKAIYREERLARAKVNEIWNAGRGQMRVYLCPLCEGYHLTHQALREK